jgi:geranylgeranyl diphosphate synthase type II
MAEGTTTESAATGSGQLPPRFAQTAQCVNAALAADAEQWLATVRPGLGEAIRYAALGPGKRIRPVLLLWSAELCAGEAGPAAMTAAVAAELLHTYSLVHDDLPAMDDDELRRGRPTCHVAYGEGVAVLVGDALLTRAFELLASAALPAERVVRLIAVLAGAAGAAGMIGGQSEDLAHERQGNATLDDVNYIHEHKTAALISACCRMGAIAAGADKAAEAALAAFGRSLGVAFQIADDLLDGDRASGKQAGRGPCGRRRGAVAGGTGRIARRSWPGGQRPHRIAAGGFPRRRPICSRSHCKQLNRLLKNGRWAHFEEKNRQF